MNLTFAGELTKMIDAGLGLETVAPDTSVAVGRYSEYIEVSDAALATFDTNAALPLRALTVNIEPIQEGTGDPSPENVRPITGRHNVTVTRVGKNLLDVPQSITISELTFTKDSDGYCSVSPNNTDPRTWLYSQCQYPDIYLKAGNYKFIIDVAAATTAPTAGYTIFYNDETTPLRAQSGEFTNVGIIVRSFTAVKDGLYGIMAKIYSAKVRFMIVPASAVDTAYEPYNAQTVGFETSETIYGGVLDVTAGTLTVTMANIASYDGETLPGKWISDRDVYAPDTTPTTGAQVVYELAEPVVVELTPQQIETLIGTNNVWSDGGNVSLTYTKYNYTEGY